MTLANALVVTIVCLPSGWAADTNTFKLTGAGTSLANEFDTNGDGLKGFTVNGTGESPLGKFTALNVNEPGAPIGFNTPHCPGAAEIPFTVLHTVFTFDDGSQFFEKLVEGYFCFLPDDTFTMYVKTQLTGGTGKFEGIKGVLETNAKGSVVLKASGPVPAPVLTQQSFEITATLEKKN